MANVALPGASVPARRYLLLDRRIVERAEGVELKVGRVEKDRRNPLFGEDKHWEVRFDNLYANVLRDPATGLYRCWYSPFIVDEATRATPRSERATARYRPRKREMGVCYAETRDGLSWRKPELGLVEFEGSKNNNLVLRGPHGAGVFLDAHEKDSSRRYKMLYVDKTMAGAFSPDGLRWSSGLDFSAIAAVGDTHNNSIWVPSIGRYVGITRLWDRTTKQRVVGRTESTDFSSWTEAVEVMRADPRHPEDQTYSMPIFECEGSYLGLVTIFNTTTDTSRCELAWSADTVHWERIDPGTPLIPLGPEGSYDSGCIYAAATPVVHDKEVWLYYGGSNGPHTGWRDGFFCLARLPRGRFAGFEPTRRAGSGTIVTKPVKVTSAQLRVNADASGGELRVGVLGSDSFSVERSNRIKADTLDGACGWRNGDLRPLVGKEVQLLFDLRSARVFSFHFA